MIEERSKRLDYYFQVVKNQLISSQSLTHGLFALHSKNRVEKFGHIRDNVYCALGIWSASLAYRYLDNDGGRQHELQQSAVKCMRGILFFLMQQSDKVERFKKDQQPENALHCQFDVKTGQVYKSEESSKNNLQIDCISLYLLSLTQMIASGLDLIFTIDEVHFIQNLVYYVERTYRTADYGIWGRGTRYNNGSRELHASSIGMALAALEAINGFNLYGGRGTLSSVIYVDPDAHYRNISILHSLLPRESNSKKTDASLLTIIGFPAFAIDDEELRNKTKDNIVEMLSGKCGIKRFLTDGYGTVYDSPRYYEKAELKQFEGIESEWPIFNVLLAIEAVFNNDINTAKEIMSELEPLCIFTRKGKMLPKYFYITKDETENPSNAIREPCPEMYLMGQSLLLIANLLVEELISPWELDPIQRRCKLKAKFSHYNNRYSAFKTHSMDLLLQVCLISQNKELQANLATYGIETQTPKEIEPMVICSPHELVRVYEELGKNSKMKLSGRPLRPLGSLGTSKMYKICGKTVVTHPLMLDQKGYYMALDMSLLVDNLKNCLAFIRKNWKLVGRPTICIYLQDHNFRGRGSTEMVDFMAALKTGQVDGINVKLGTVQMFVSTACVEHLDYLTTKHCSNINIISSEEDYLPPSLSGFESVYHQDRQTLTEEHHMSDLAQLSTQQLIESLQQCSNLSTGMKILQHLAKNEGMNFDLGEGTTVRELVSRHYVRAGYTHDWNTVRRGAALLCRQVESLAPSITSMLVARKRVCLGAFGRTEYVISEPITPADIMGILSHECMGDDPRDVSLHQELIIHIGSIISTNAKYFEGMLNIRVGWIIQAMKSCLENAHAHGAPEMSLYSLYPSEIKQLLLVLLTGHGYFRDIDFSPRNQLERRSLDGALNRLPSEFYEKVWYLLQNCTGGLKLVDYHLSPQPLISVMVKDEVDFKLRVEELLSRAVKPVERQLVVELIIMIALILGRNPELHIHSTIKLMELVNEAIQMYLKQSPGKTVEDFYMLKKLAACHHPNLQQQHLDQHSDQQTDQQTDQHLDQQSLPEQQKHSNGSFTYLAHAAVHHLIQNSTIVSKFHQDLCAVS